MLQQTRYMRRAVPKESLMALMQGVGFHGDEAEPHTFMLLLCDARLLFPLSHFGHVVFEVELCAQPKTFAMSAL